MFKLGFHGLDASVKKRSPLTYEEAFSLASLVFLTSNQNLYDAMAPRVHGCDFGLLDEDTLRLHSVSLLQSMSTREAILGLSPDEIAGMVAATLELDTVARVKSSNSGSIIGIGGMGGDKGLPINGQNSKLFSLSTLAALALSQEGTVHKHHSYPNTSKVAGQSAIESMGARSDFDSSDYLDQIIDEADVLMSSCHSTRTLHTVSHILKGETINHVIGPLAIPQASEDTVNAFIGVNQNVHPSTLVDSLIVLNEKGIQSYGNSVAFCGIDKPFDEVPSTILDPKTIYADEELKKMVALDEVPPPPYTTMAAFMVNGQNTGTYLIPSTDFMPEDEALKLQKDGLMIPNTTEAILKANSDVIHARDLNKARYLAMTVALALFTRDYAHLPDALNPQTNRVNKDYLQECYQQALNTVTSPQMEKRTHVYIEATHKDPAPGIDAVIFDVDNTLAIPKDPQFYKKYGLAVENAIAKHLEIDLDRAEQIAQFYRNTYGGGEHALFSSTIQAHFPEFSMRSPNFDLLYDEMSQIDPSAEFEQDRALRRLLRVLRHRGKIVVALTDSPEDLSRRILSAVGLEPEKDFDLYLPYTRENGPLKIVGGLNTFRGIADSIGVPPARILSIGDSFEKDIKPAVELGMSTCLISPQVVENYKGVQASNVFKAFEEYRRSLCN